MSAAFDLVKFFDEKAAWSRAAFGPQQRVSGVVAHIRKELAEIREALGAGDTGKACEEFVDVALLAIDLAWRSGPHVDGLVFVTALNKCQRFWIGDSTFEGAASAALQGMLLAAVEVHLSAIERTGLWWAVRLIERAAMIWEIAMAGAAAEPREAERRLLAKYSEIQTRKVKDWRDVPADQPIEHVREAAKELPRVGIVASPITVTIDPSAVTYGALAARVKSEVDRLGTVACHRPDSSALVLLRDVPPNGMIKGGDTLTIAQLVAEHRELAAIREDVRHPPDNVEATRQLQLVRAVLGAGEKETTLQAADRKMRHVDGLGAELGRVRDAIHPNEDESASAAAARVWGELLTAQKQERDLRAGVLDALGRRGDEDPVKTAGYAAQANRTLLSDREEWRGDNERLREERQQVRGVLGARPNESVLDAAKRVVTSADLVDSVAAALADAKKANGARVGEDVASAARRVAREFVVPIGAVVERRQFSVGYTLDEPPAVALAPGEEAPQ